jgi:hypothetical protein
MLYLVEDEGTSLTIRVFPFRPRRKSPPSLKPAEPLAESSREKRSALPDTVHFLSYGAFNGPTIIAEICLSKVHARHSIHTSGRIWILTLASVQTCQ